MSSDTNTLHLKKAASTRKNERRLLCLKKIVDRDSNLTPEFKLSVKLYIDWTIQDIKERNIATYHDLIDYLKERAELAIENSDNLTPEQRMNRRALVYILAELAKRRRCEKKPFWTGCSR